MRRKHFEYYRHSMLMLVPRKEVSDKGYELIAS